MKEFGRMFGLAESTISSYEKNARNPDIDTLAKFADYYNVSMDFLMGRKLSSSSDLLIKSDNGEPIVNLDALMQRYNLTVNKKIVTAKEWKGAVTYVKTSRLLNKEGEHTF